MDYPIKFTVNYTLNDRSDLLDFIKLANYSSRYAREAGIALLEHLDLPTFVEEVVINKKYKPKIVEYKNEDMPF